MVVQSITCKWIVATIVFRCKECRRNIYPGHYVRMESAETYCYGCGSRRQDDLKRRIRENTHQIQAVAGVAPVDHSGNCLPGAGENPDRPGIIKNQKPKVLQGEK